MNSFLESLPSFGQYGFDLVGAHWLRNYIVHSALNSLLDILFLRMTGDSKDERLYYLVVSAELSDLYRRLVAVHARHVAVHEDYVVVGLRVLHAHLVEGLHSVERSVDLLSDFQAVDLEQDLHCVNVEDEVISYQNPRERCNPWDEHREVVSVGDGKVLEREI